MYEERNQMLDSQLCHKARISRDARFDGQFFTAVITTGIFCRPICPARPPKEENVRYFQFAEQALNAGFQPCKRCLPELAPNSKLPVSIEQLLAQFDTAENMAELAKKVFLSERQIRRLFQQHLGLSPSQYKQTQRVLLARKLLRESQLSITNVALAAGFNSIRRFNEAIKQQFALTPTKLRAQLQKGEQIETDEVQISLSYRPPFSWQAMLAFFQARQIPMIEQITAHYWRRVFATADVQGYVQVEQHPSKQALLVTAKLSDYRYLQWLLAQIRRVFDLDVDINLVQTQLKQDPLLNIAINQNPGLRLPGCFDLFEFSIRAILGQQVSVKAATTLASRIVAKYGRKALANPWGLSHYFPTLADLQDADFQQIGLTQTRQQTIKNWLKFYQQANTETQLYGVSLSELEQRLTAIKGIGPWTVNYLAMRGLSMPDAFPSADLGIIKALTENNQKPSNKQILQRAEAWRPWRAYSAIYLWHSNLAQS